MSVTPNEIETMRAPIARAHGRVLTFGLGIGYFAFMAASKADVESVTVVEREAAVIRLFTRLLLPQFPCAQKSASSAATRFTLRRTRKRSRRLILPSPTFGTMSPTACPPGGACARCFIASPQLEAMYWIEDTMRYYE